MEFIKGFNFINHSDCRGNYCNEESKAALRAAKKIGLTHINLVFSAFQETAHSEEIRWDYANCPSSEDLLKMVAYAKEIGFRVILKPMLDCLDGTWRARINFFDIDVPCETKWSTWFQNYETYMCYCAEIAQQSGCEMLVIGTEMIQTERRASEWIHVIQEVRKIYSGLITYNTDKYQEENVSWWDHVDVISASGYYPIDQIGEQLQRIKRFVKRYNKPYFFAEAGCPSRKGNQYNPNDWAFEGDYDESAQADWYEEFLRQSIHEDWLYGYTFWSWSHFMSETCTSRKDPYDIHGKLAEHVVEKYMKER